MEVKNYIAIMRIEDKMLIKFKDNKKKMKINQIIKKKYKEKCDMKKKNS